MKIKIVAAIVDTRQLTLYRADGESMTIKQGDPRLRTILDQVTPQIVARGFAEIEITDIVVVSGFQQFEKQSGLVRFFKVAREKLKDLFAPPVDAAAVGKVPSMREGIEPVEEAPSSPFASMDKAVAETSAALRGEPTDEETALAAHKAAIDEVLRHAEPVSSDSFNTENVRQQGNIVEEDGSTDNQRREAETSHTIVAQVGNTLIPDMERIETHFTRAAKLGSPGGVEKFLQRLAAVISQRSHSVEDLLKFMERADMPIADDGSVIIFKMLQRRDGHYVDCHTKKVQQKVGSYVCMDIKLVDRNRNQECSNGLHVGRRAYMAGFSGDVIVLAKLAPEDVVTVPTYDANKMRVMGYHILAEVTKPMFDLVKKNKSITELDDGKVLLGKVLSGDHVPRLEEVRITGQAGEGVIVTPITINAPTKGAPPAIEAAVEETAEVRKEEALENPGTMKQDKPLNPKDVVKNVQGLSRKEQAQKLFKAYQKSPNQKNKAKLIAYKKSVKISWKLLGINEDDLK